MIYVRLMMMLATCGLTLWTSFDRDAAGWIGAFGSAVWIYANALALRDQVGAE